MKTFYYTAQFKKLYRKLPITIQNKVKKQLTLLANNIHHPSLRAKKMVNKEGVWEARVDYSYRITFELDEEKIVLRAVGSHQIYRK